MYCYVKTVPIISHVICEISTRCS